MSGYLWLVIAFVANGVANVFLKLGALRGLTLSGGAWRLFTANWEVLLGLLLFAANVVFYFLALRALPLSVAYPVMVAMSFLIVNTFALVFLGEAIGVLEICGYGLIILGVVLVVARSA